MKSASTSRVEDYQDNPIPAAKAYEDWLKSNTAPLDAYLDLAVLYFMANDGGYAAAHKLPKSFLDLAWTRMTQVLLEAEQHHGSHPEIEFWRRYFRFILLGEDWMTPDECVELANSGETLVPFFYLYKSFAGLSEIEAKRFEGEALRLLEAVSSAHTARQRYIRSVLLGGK